MGKKHKYKCLLCGRDDFNTPTPHNCIGGFRKRKLKWEKVIEDTPKEWACDLEGEIKELCQLFGVKYMHGLAKESVCFLCTDFHNKKIYQSIII